MSNGKVITAENLVGLLIAATAVSNANAIPIRVAVEDATGMGGGIATVAQLNNDTFFDFTATLVNAAAIDTAAELANYDVVLLGGSGHDNADWSTAMANALVAYVTGGGGLVMTGWGNYDLNSGPADLILEPLVPGQNGPSTNQYTSGSTPLNFVNGPHAVTAGLPSFAPGANFIEVNSFAPEVGDLVLATAANPANIAVAVKNNIGAGGRSVYLGPLYMANNSYNTASLRTGFADQLLEQAVCWAANNCAPNMAQNVPAPGALALLGLSLVGLGGLRRIGRHRVG